MKLLALGLLFLSTCQSQFIYPEVNDVLYADNTYNISWNSSNSELHNQNELHLFLTNYIDNIHNNLTISNYDNGTAILNSYIGNESNYEWDIPYGLNKYNIHLHNFKLLLSNTSTPFMFTLGNPNFLYYYSDNFRIYSNLSISHPEHHEIVNPNTSYIAYHGFQNNLTISFLYYSPLTESYIPVPSLIYNVEPSDSPYYFEYEALHPYSQYLLQAKIVESISHIELSSSPFYLMGINMTTPSSAPYVNPSNILLTWDNYNYNGTNTIYINNQNSLYDTIVINNETEYNLDVSTYNSGIYNITITNDLYPNQIYQSILLNILFSTSTTTATDTTVTMTDTTVTDTTTTVTDTTTTVTDTTTTVTDTTITNTSFTTLTTLDCLNCTENISHNDDDSDAFNYLYLIAIIGGCILVILLAYCIDRKCKQMKKKHEENKVSPQEGIKMDTIACRTTYTGTGFVDPNSHEYNHLNRSRVLINENYQTSDNTSNNSSISYNVRTYSNTYDEALPSNKTTYFQ